MSVQKFLQVLPTTLAGSGVGLTDTSIVLSSLRFPDGTEVLTGHLGDVNYATLGIGRNQEVISFTNDITKNVDGTTTLNVVVRGLRFGSPYTADSSLRKAHSGGSSFIISNNPQMYQDLVSTENDETITGTYTYTAPNYPQIDNPLNPPTQDEQFVTKKYVDDAAFAGANLNKIVVDAIAGDTIAENDIVYFDEGDEEWKLASATFVNQADYLVGLSMGAGTDGNAIDGGVMTQGIKTGFSGLDSGEPYFMSDTAGEISTTVGTITFELGYAQSATQLYFFPKFKSYITKDQKDALQGTEGTPSNTNRYVTDDDTATTSTANAVVRGDGSGKIDMAWLPKDVQIFTTSDTWTKPTGARYVYVEVLSAGGGGGGGRRATSAVDDGGAGGGGGYLTQKLFNASDLTDTVSVAVGIGGIGGAGFASGFADGTSGTDGGNSSFGSYLISIGGSGGSGGGTASPKGGNGGRPVLEFLASPHVNAVSNQGANPQTGTYTASPSAEFGGGGGGNSSDSLTVSNRDGGSSIFSGGGGGGGGADSGASGAAGGSGGNTNSYVAGGGGAGGTAGNGGAGLSGGNGNAGGFMQGGGGGGSVVYSSSPVSGGNGGPGGVGAGGGGGGTRNGNTGTSGAAGNGGPGGRGEVRVYTW